MDKKHWPMIGALAALGAFLIAWRNSSALPSAPLAFTPGYDVSPFLGPSYGPQVPNADAPNIARDRAVDLNSPTYAGYGRDAGVISTFLGKLTRRTWGVPIAGTQSPSIPYVDLVPGQQPQNRDLITEATAQENPSVSDDPDESAIMPDMAVYDSDLL